MDYQEEQTAQNEQNEVDEQNGQLVEQSAEVSEPVVIYEDSLEETPIPAVAVEGLPEYAAVETSPEPPGKTPGKGLAIGAMVVGICSCVLAIAFYLSIPAGIVAIILAAVAMRRRYPGRGMAIAGLSTGIVGVFLAFFWAVMFFFALAVGNRVIQKLPPFDRDNAGFFQQYEYSVPDDPFFFKMD